MPGYVDVMPEPPNLQKLVREAGGYWKITSQQWALYDKETLDAQLWLAARHKVVKRSKGSLGHE